MCIDMCIDMCTDIRTRHRSGHCATAPKAITIGHNYIGHDYTSHNYKGQNFIGHIGHGTIGNLSSRPVKKSIGRDVCACWTCRRRRRYRARQPRPQPFLKKIAKVGISALEQNVCQPNLQDQRSSDCVVAVLAHFRGSCVSCSVVCSISETKRGTIFRALLFLTRLSFFLSKHVLG